MTNKRFKVRRIGGEYVTEPASVRSLDYEDLGMVLMGAGLFTVGFMRRSTAGAALLVLGATMANYGLKGRKGLRKKAVRAVRRAGQALRGERDGPSFPGEAGSAGGRQMPEDQVDEESMESFPASDSPGHGSRTK
jgi:hypothetical protein